MPALSPRFCSRLVVISAEHKCQNRVEGRSTVLDSEERHPHVPLPGPLHPAGSAVRVGGTGCWWEELNGGCCQDLGRLVLPLAPGS